ncbi:hypothetical protein CJD36_004680 [Flavipsychrobacter stenotrophus]|uniref:DUF4465 domain-containing protein n=1 Tax=Flavipsychrobacter stenotrophus TaxID=2077091 RepID=A0A2S7T1E6_9BACT|nr:hypothetical protein [Flavipsychrobacter stenotrophus]PQJ13043.1 hypothetical protein CJD36_004680 [Flavipsychrobacter stenotrophus]
MSKKMIAALAVALTGILACNKNYNNAPTTTYSSIKEAFADQAPKAKVVTINAATGGSFRGNSGTRYVFPANAFRNSVGDVVTGDVQIEVKEFVDKSDMMFSGVLPVTTTQPLISGGETSVNATQNGQALTMAPGVTFQANMPQVHNGDTAAMDVFTGHKDANGNVVWTQNDPASGGGISFNGDTTVITNDSMDMCNADRFLSSPNYQSFYVTVTTSDGAVVSSDLSGYTLYDDYNGVWPMYHQTTATKFNEGHVPDIAVHFVVVGLINGRFYGGIKGATPANDSTYNVVLKPTTPAAFKLLVKAL